MLDTSLTEVLIEEGFVREIISKIQTMRKEADFNVMDRINIIYSENDAIKNIIEKNTDEISNDVLADSIVTGTPIGFIKEWDVNGENVTFGVAKA